MRIWGVGRSAPPWHSGHVDFQGRPVWPRQPPSPPRVNKGRHRRGATDAERGEPEDKGVWRSPPGVPHYTTAVLAASARRPPWTCFAFSCVLGGEVVKLMAPDLFYALLISASVASLRCSPPFAE
jgi:hypothetical protein